MTVSHASRPAQRRKVRALRGTGLCSDGWVGQAGGVTGPLVCVRAEIHSAPVAEGERGATQQPSANWPSEKSKLSPRQLREKCAVLSPPGLVSLGVGEAEQECPWGGMTRRVLGPVVAPPPLEHFTALLTTPGSRANCRLEPLSMPSLNHDHRLVSTKHRHSDKRARGARNGITLRIRKQPGVSEVF